MADLSDRTKREKELEAAIVIILLMMRDEWVQTASTKWTAAREAFVAKVGPLLADTAATASERLAKEHGVENAARFRVGADEWGAKRAGALADQIITRTRDTITSTPEQPDTDALFGRTRAEGVAVTETTRASTEGERHAARALEAMRTDSKTAVAIWHTAKDSKVCPICKPLEGLPEYRWPPRFRFPHTKAAFVARRDPETGEQVAMPLYDLESVIHTAAPGGPPAHPNCRCWVDWEMKTKGTK